MIQVAVALAAADGGGSIEADHLDLPGGAAAPPAATDYHRQVDALRRRLVRGAMAAARGNRAEAARRLGLSRQALSYLVKQLKLA